MRSAVRDCGLASPLPGLARVIVLGAVSLGSIAIAWTFPIGWAFVAWSAIAAICYAFWLVATHDAAHHTLTGWAFVDEAIARAIAWPILWPVGTYSELHRLHHSWNGRRLDDPERTQWTQAEYDRASPALRWYVRNQWLADVFGLGALGLIGKMMHQGIRQGWLAAQPRSRVRWQLAIDLLGMASVQAVVLAWVVSHEALLQYGLFWLAIERVVGMIMQCREHIEHYGLWENPPAHARSQILTQLYATRNVHAPAIVNWLMGGLPYHAVHHAFPEMPFDRLPIAYERLDAALCDRGLPPLVRDPGYWQTSLHLATTFRTIAADTSQADIPQETGKTAD